MTKYTKDVEPLVMCQCEICTGEYICKNCRYFCKIADRLHVCCEPMNRHASFKYQYHEYIVDITTPACHLYETESPTVDKGEANGTKRKD